MPIISEPFKKCPIHWNKEAWSLAIPSEPETPAFRHILLSLNWPWRADRATAAQRESFAT